MRLGQNARMQRDTEAKALGEEMKRKKSRRAKTSGWSFAGVACLVGCTLGEAASQDM